MMLGGYSEIRLSIRPIFYYFFLVFALVELCDIFLPYRALGYDLFPALFYYLIFILNFCFLFFLSSILRKKMIVKLPSEKFLSKLLMRFLIISFFSFVFVVFDRIFIQGVDYSQGIALARESWREEAIGRDGASSLINVVGNIFFPLVFLVFALSFVFFESLTSPKVYLYLSTALIFFFSLLTGGRELFLILIAMAIASMSFRRFFCISGIPSKLYMDGLLFLLVVLLFSVYIGYQRSLSYSDGLDWYSNLLAERLGGQNAQTAFPDMMPSFLKPVLIYFAHVKWIFINTIEFNYSEGLSTFRQVVLLAERYLSIPIKDFGFVVPEYSPNWISGVGSFYYDMGIFGIFVIYFLVVVGWWIFINTLRLKKLNQSMLSVMFGIVYSAVCVMLPFAFMLEIVQFIYLFVLLGIGLIISFVPKFRWR